jgi:hypothetical protein
VKKAPASMMLSVAHTAIQHRRRLLLSGKRDLEWIHSTVVEEERALQNTLEQEAEEIRREIEAIQREAAAPDLELMNALAHLSAIGNAAASNDEDDGDGDGFALFANLQNLFAPSANDARGKHSASGKEDDDDDDDEPAIAGLREIKHEHKVAQKATEEQLSAQKLSQREKVAQRVRQLESKAGEARRKADAARTNAEELIRQTQQRLTKELKANENHWMRMAQKCRKRKAVAAAHKRMQKQEGLGPTSDDNAAAASTRVDISQLREHHDKMRTVVQRTAKEAADTASPTPQQQDWQQLFDEVSNFPYYWNVKTGEVSARSSCTASSSSR